MKSFKHLRVAPHGLKILFQSSFIKQFSFSKNIHTVKKIKRNKINFENNIQCHLYTLSFLTKNKTVPIT